MTHRLARILIQLAFLGLAGSAAAEPQPRAILRTDLAHETAVPGQAIELRITVLVPTWLPEAPRLPSFEAPNLVVRGPVSTSVNEPIDGETWFGLVQSFWLHPMTVGRFRLPPHKVTIYVADAATRESVAVELLIEEISFEGVAPQGAEALDPFIAAESLSLEESIEGDPARLRPGDAVTRQVTARVTGTSPLFLPPLVQSTFGEGIAAYPKEAEVRETADRGALVGERIESVTYVAEGDARLEVPAIRLRWFNLQTGQVETSELAAFEVVSRGPWLPKLARGSLVLTLVLGLGWLACKHWGPPIVAWRERRREVYLASEAAAFAGAEDALRDHDFGRAIREVDAWLGRMPDLDENANARLSRSFAQLGASLYGGVQKPPSPLLWSEALEAIRFARSEYLAAATGRGQEALPRLNPRLAVFPDRTSRV